MPSGNETQGYSTSSKTVGGGVVLAVIYALVLRVFQRGTLDYNVLVFLSTFLFIGLSFYGFSKEKKVFWPSIWMLFAISGGVLLVVQIF